MRFQPGMVRVCIEPKEDEPFIPDSWIEEKIFNLPYIETIEQSGASGYLIIAMFSSLRRAGEAQKIGGQALEPHGLGDGFVPGAHRGKDRHVGLEFESTFQRVAEDGMVVGHND